MICKLLFPSSVSAVESNRKSLVIMLEMEIYVFHHLCPSQLPPTALQASTSSQHQSGDLPLSFLSINSTGSLLATSSDKGTAIRVWSIPGAEQLYQFIRGTRATICSINFNLVSLLFSVYDTIWEPFRDFAFLRLPTSVANVICLSLIRTMPHVMVISSDGYFHSTYSIDLDKGGECSLMKQYR
ncbi:hypothetical protein BYT27DRAFT_7237268 [Phlegmacium glaucopus]|nr:hypothetical protein BYT27DRAFT_7237268 [Phlegmacium glaucopus]